MDPGYEPTAAQRHNLASLLMPWFSPQRWFAGMGHDVTEVTVCEAFTLPGPVAAVALVVGTLLDGDHWKTHQVPVSLYAEPREGLAPISQLEGWQWVYDGLRDPAAASSMLAASSGRPRSTRGSPMRCTAPLAPTRARNCRRWRTLPPTHSCR
jgi:hypothetical protein